MLDADGNFYGTNSEGGYGDSFGGTVFELIPGTWAATILSVFSHLPASDHPPLGPLALDASRNVYGTVASDGSSGGAVFKTGNGGFNAFGFSGRATSAGELPQGGVVLDAQANVYGTTSAGGAYGKGTVFEIVFP